MRKEFDLEYYLEHKDVKIVTRDGGPVRIICTDRKSDEGYIIVALRADGKFERANAYTGHGKVMIGEDNNIDLFMEVPEEYDFKPFDKVLVRDNELQPWRPTFVAYIVDDNSCVDNARYCWQYVIPYEGNEHLCNRVE